MQETIANRYKLQHRIAIGGTAEVFRATFAGPDGNPRPVVIKRVLPQFARDERFRRLFDEEARVALGVEHPNIVRVLEHGKMGETCFIAMELVEGQDLAQLLAAARSRRKPLPAGLAAHVAARVGDALSFIHHRTNSGGTPLKIIHRDVSPQNILVSWDGEVKLTDFGIAKSIMRQEKTVDGTLRGKLEYMAPEQALLAEVDHRADIFSLGCVLYEMLHGSPPFHGENELETLERLRSGVMEVSPQELAADELLKQVLGRALARQREDRYQRARQLVDDLELFLERHPSPLGPEVLGLWAREVGTESSPPAVSAVDLAVQRLLGGAVEETPEPEPATTSVFASSGPHARIAAPLSAAPASAQARAGSSRRPLYVMLALLLVVGVSGWLLWAFHHFSRQDPPPPLAPRSIAPAADAAASAPPLARPAPAPLPPRPPKPTRPRPRTRASGYLTVNSMPWSRVRLNGRIIGNTPVVKQRIPAGSHRLELLSAKGKLRRSLRIKVPAGRTRTYSFDLTEKR